MKTVSKPAKITGINKMNEEWYADPWMIVGADFLASASDNPSHPQGVWSYEEIKDWEHWNSEIGTPWNWDDLPETLKRFLVRFFEPDRPLVDRLKDMKISFAYGASEALVPHTMLCVDEFELIHQAFDITSAWDKELKVSIGKGIEYRLTYSEDSTALHIHIHAQADCFAAPCTVTVFTTKEPEDFEHNESCPFHSHQAYFNEPDGTAFLIDEMGEKYYAYDFECHCEWVETTRKVFELDPEDLSLDEAATYFHQLTIGEIA